MEKKKITIQKNRMLWADIIRIVAIYLVVQVHTATLPFLSNITIICVPLFVMLSGALLLNKDENYSTFFKKRLIKVLIPWIIWTIIYMFYFLYYYESANIIQQFFSDQRPLLVQWTHFFIQMFLSNLWFLPLIFSLYLITPIVRVFIKNTKEKDIYYFLFLWFTCISLVPYFLKSPLFPHWEPNVVFTMVQYSGYFILGIVLLKKLTNKQKPFTVLFLTALCIAGLSLSQGFSYVFLSPGTVVSSIAGFSLLFIFSKNLEKTINNNFKLFITRVSKASLGVYIIHQIISNFLTINGRHLLQNYNADLLFPLVVFTISTCIVIVLQKIPVVKYAMP